MLVNSASLPGCVRFISTSIEMLLMYISIFYFVLYTFDLLSYHNVESVYVYIYICISFSIYIYIYIYTSLYLSVMIYVLLL
jgi:hypothetical protein